MLECLVSEFVKGIVDIIWEIVHCWTKNDIWFSTHEKKRTAKEVGNWISSSATFSVTPVNTFAGIRFGSCCNWNWSRTWYEIRIADTCNKTCVRHYTTPKSTWILASHSILLRKISVQTSDVLSHLRLTWLRYLGNAIDSSVDLY
jgi:hypothetical protein